MSETLEVWFNQSHVATLISDGPGGGASLTYTTEAVKEYGPLYPLLSVRLPVAEQMYPATKTREFLDGLLPEDSVREQLANRARIATDDTFGMLRAYGLDCAGAVQIIEPGKSRSAEKPGVIWLDENQLKQAVSDLPVAPLGVAVDEGVRSSLGGLQGKLLVVRSGDKVGIPTNGEPSTHILKPTRLLETGEERWPGIAQLELMGLRLIKACGQHGLSVTAAEASVIDISGRSAILVERFDREQSPDGSYKRIHQEDFCQALGITAKYQNNDFGPPRLSDIAEVLKANAANPQSELLKLLELVVLNIAIGNCDMHARNIALMLKDGQVSLTPAYDVVPTVVWTGQSGRLPHSRDLALRIGNEMEIEEVRGQNLLNEAVTWGIRLPAAKKTVTRSLNALTQVAPEAFQAAQREGWHHPLMIDLEKWIHERIELLAP